MIQERSIIKVVPPISELRPQSEKDRLAWIPSVRDKNQTLVSFGDMRDPRPVQISKRLYGARNCSRSPAKAGSRTVAGQIMP